MTNERNLRPLDGVDSDSKIGFTTESVAAQAHISPETFLKICPALLVQIEQGSCIERQYRNIPVAINPVFEPMHKPHETKDKYSGKLHTNRIKQGLNPFSIRFVSFAAWIWATVSVTIISLCGLIGVVMVPLSKFGAYREILRFLVALAIGSLAGDALMVCQTH